MMMQMDLECSRCKAIYKNTDDKVLVVMYHYAMFSICPKCTGEVAALMGYTKEVLMSELSLIKEAETKNNRKRRTEEGIVCAKCELKFKENEARVGTSIARNTKKYHLDCYEKIKEKLP